MPQTDHWPNNFAEMKNNKKGQRVYTFEPVEVTIRRVFPPKMDGGKMQFATGWSFREDTTSHERGTGVIWSHPGMWNNDDRAFTQAYPGPTGHEGQRVRVRLSMTEADDRNFYNLQDIVIVGEAEAQPEPQGGSYVDKELPGASTPQTAALTVDQRINLGMAFNNLTVLLASGIPDKAMTLGAEDAVENWGSKWEQWHKWFSEASRGLPLSPVQDEPEQGEDVDEPDF